MEKALRNFCNTEIKQGCKITHKFLYSDVIDCSHDQLVLPYATKISFLNHEALTIQNMLL